MRFNKIIHSALFLVSALLSACGGGGDGGGGGGGGATSYTVGGSVSGLSGSVVLQNNGGDNLTVTTNATFTFATKVANGGAYSVTVLTQPTGQTCTVTNGAGTVATTNVSAVNVTCVTASSSTGTNLTGTLVGPIVAGTQTALQNQATLQNNGSDNLTATVTQSAGSTTKYDKTAFSFPTKLADGTAYAVSVLTPPTGQTCKAFAGASGAMPAAANSLWVGCEQIYDQLVRSTDDLVFGAYSGSSKPVLGGSNVAIGSTSTAYGEGRYAVFLSTIKGIAGGNTNGFAQVFWRDRYTGVTRLVSASAAGVEGDNSSYAAVISADGMTVAFESYATNLVANDTNARSDIFVWSALNPGAGVQRVSVGAGGVEANGASANPSLSGDGKVLAFDSYASNLTAGVSGNSSSNVYRKDLTTGAIKLISVNEAGQPQSSALPVLSEDGQRLVFYSYWPLLASDTNSLWDIYLYDHTATTPANGLVRVSLTSTGADRNQGTESVSRLVAPAISGNGRYVAFATTATNMVPGGTASTCNAPLNTVCLQNVYVVDTQPVGGGVMPVTLASVSSSGALGNGDSPVGQGERLSLSYDGQWVAFTSKASNLVSGTTMSGCSNVLMHNISTAETRALTTLACEGVGGPVSMSRTGAYAAFWAGTPLDPRFNGSGLFARFTGMQNAFSWTQGALP
jgi:hypothetical protein